jgi:hypothetical protein
VEKLQVWTKGLASPELAFILLQAKSPRAHPKKFQARGLSLESTEVAHSLVACRKSVFVMLWPTM